MPYEEGGGGHLKEVQTNHPAHYPLPRAVPEHKIGGKEKRRKAASFQTMSQLHKVRLTPRGGKRSIAEEFRREYSMFCAARASLDG